MALNVYGPAPGSVVGKHALIQWTTTKKLLIVVKLTLIFLIAACLAASASGHAQRITLSAKNEPLTNVIAEIEKQSGLSFIYGKGLIQRADRVNLEVKDQSIGVVLDLLFKYLPVDYKIADRYVVLSPKEKIAPPSSTEFLFEPPPINVKGRVLNEKGNPVTATITVKGSNQAIGTNEDGSFQLKNVSESATLVITGIGIETREVRVNGQAELGTLVVKIKATPMDELQVIAYGVSSKRFNVGAVSTITSKEIQQQPTNNVMLALQGRIPGLAISSFSGTPGGSIKIQVRGQNTLQSTTATALPFDQPLIILDGVPFAPQNNNINMLTSAGGGNVINIAGYQGFGPLSSINPSDIESISVLRDADATSIYGSQGANGVIIITTKKGVAGKTSLSVSVNTGPNKVTRRLKYLNTQQYLQVRHEALNNDGITLPSAYDGRYPDLQLFDTTRYTDWFHEFFGKTSNNTDIHASLSGGSLNNTFIISTGYNRTTYNFPGDFAEERMSLHSGLHHNSVDSKLTVDFSSDFSYNRNNNSSSPDAVNVNKLPPNTPQLLDENGNLIWNYKGLDLGFSQIGQDLLSFQQYAYLIGKYNLRKYELNNSLQLSYKLVGGLSALVNLGYSRFNTDERSQYPIAGNSPSNPFREGTASFARKLYETINIEPQLNYQQNIGRGVFTALVGASYKRNNEEDEIVTGSGYTNDGFLNSLSGAARIVEASSSDIIYKYIGVYGRARYVYNNKYIFNITGRRDGSTSFGPGRQYGTFGSGGAGWIFSEEKFFAGLKPAVSFAKLSANYGTNGSDGIAPYNYQAFWNTPQYTSLFQGNRPYIPLNLYNPDYSWANKKSFNLTLDLGFFSDRLMATVVWYKNSTDNQLVSGILPGQTGFTSVVSNLNATIQNKGWEFAFSSNPIKSKNFNWLSNLNLSRNRNKLARFPDLERSPYFYNYRVGRSTSSINGYRFKGVNPQTGVFEFYDGKGQTTGIPNFEFVENGGDLQFIEDLQQGWFGGWDNTFSYKGINLSLFFQFSQQIALNYLGSIYGSNQPGFPYNVPALVLDRWQKPGDITALQKFTTNTNSAAYTAGTYFSGSDGAYSDATYLRLKTVSLSYYFPAALIKKAGMENLRVYLNMQNVLLITGYKFGDPEQGSLAGIPIQRTIACGLSFNF